jgi:hypothetical protein
MRRQKQHRTVLKNLIKDERTTPDRAMLAERLMKCLDAVEGDALQLYEMQTLQHVGGPKLVELFLTQLDRLSNVPARRLLRDDNDDGGHITTQNRLLRDRRSHPNRRLILQIEAMNEDAETQRERLFYSTIILAGCIDSAQHFRLRGIDDVPFEETHTTNADKAVMDQAKKHLEAIMGGMSAGSTS